jgi:hypothetical protein
MRVKRAEDRVGVYWVWNKPRDGRGTEIENNRKTFTHTASTLAKKACLRILGFSVLSCDSADWVTMRHSFLYHGPHMSQDVWSHGCCTSAYMRLMLILG